MAKQAERLDGKTLLHSRANLAAYAASFCFTVTMCLDLTERAQHCAAFHSTVYGTAMK